MGINRQDGIGWSIDQFDLFFRGLSSSSDNSLFKTIKIK